MMEDEREGRRAEYELVDTRLGAEALTSVADEVKDESKGLLAGSVSLGDA